MYYRRDQRGIQRPSTWLEEAPNWRCITKLTWREWCQYNHELGPVWHGKRVPLWRSGELCLPALKFPPFFSYSKFNMLGAPSLTGSRDFTWAEKFLYQGGWIIDCRFLALFLGLVFGYFDFEGMTLLRKMLSVRVVCCHSFELIYLRKYLSGYKLAERR